MVIYFNIINGHLNGWSSSKEGYEYELKVPDNHEVLINPEIFKFEDGELIKDEVYQRQLIEKESQENAKPTDEELNPIAIMELTEMLMGGSE